MTTTVIRDAPGPGPSAPTADLNAEAVDTDLVRTYLNDIGRVSLLTAAQEVELAGWAEAGVLAEEALRVGTHLAADERADLAAVADLGEQAKDRLLTSNLRLVVSIAKRYAGQGLPLLDLVQEGNLGLIRAVEMFDHRLGFKFSTYATWWVRQAINRSLSDQSRTIRIPVHVLDEIRRAERTRRQLTQDTGRPALVAEIAADLGTTDQRVRELLSLAREPVSLDTTLGESGEGRLGDLVEDSNAEDAVKVVEATMLRDDIARVLSSLTEREQQLVTLRFGLDDGWAKTLDHVGRVLGVTRERARQIEGRVLAKLRADPLSAPLIDYLR